MKILHTADWHLGTRLGGHDLTPVLLQQVERVAAICDEHEIDVLLVAGDAFEKKHALAEVTRQLAAILRPRVRRGLHVVLAFGNHDDRAHFRMMRELLALNDESAAGRIHIVETPEILSIKGAHFGVVPYPNRAMLDEESAHGDANTAYAALVREWGEKLETAAQAANEPAIFVLHVTIAGVTTPTGHEINYNEELRLGREELPANVDYIAIGHIHQMQRIKGAAAPTYYSGSLDRLNMGEYRDDKFVLEVELQSGEPARITPISLPVSPFHKVRVRADELENLAQTRPEIVEQLQSGAFAHFEIECAPGDDKIALRRRVGEISPRALDVRLGDDSDDVLESANSPAASSRMRDPRATALAYLREQFANDPDLPALENAAHELINELVGAPLENSPLENSPLENSPLANSPLANSPLANSPLANSFSGGR